MMSMTDEDSGLKCLVLNFVLKAMERSGGMLPPKK